MWVKDGQTVTPKQLRAANPNVSIPKDFASWELFGAEKVAVYPQPDAPFGKTPQLKAPEIKDGFWVAEWELVAWPDEQRKEAISAECRRRIYEIADETAQINLVAANGAGMLTPEHVAVWKSGLQWVAAMRAQYQTIFTQGLDPYDDANWPDVPAGVAELGAAF